MPDDPMTSIDDIPGQMTDLGFDVTQVNGLGEVTADASGLGAIGAADMMGDLGYDPFAFRLDSYGRVDSWGGSDGWGGAGSGGGGGGGGGGGNFNFSGLPDGAGGGGGGTGYRMDYAPSLPELGVTGDGLDGSSLKPGDIGLHGPLPAFSVSNFDPEQVSNARTIVETGKRLGASRRDVAVALMAAMQESGLRNLNYGDRDSVGLFQQRDAWGSFQDRTNPAKAAEMFFTGGQAGQQGLFDVEGRGTMDLGKAAQTVQVSAYPDRYDQWADDALAMLVHIHDNKTNNADVPQWRQQVIAGARKMIGTPYVWGGTSYSGVDCSGLVQLMYKQVGIDLPRISAAQAVSGDRIPLDELAPGDLVGWDNSSRNNGADHIAIYIGNGQIIEAARPGTLVHISPLYDTGQAWGVSMAQYDPFRFRHPDKPKPEPRPSRSGGRGPTSSGPTYTASSGSGSSHYSGGGGSGGGGSSYHSSQPTSGGHPVGDPTPSHGGHVKPKPKPPTHNGGGHSDPDGPII